MSKVHQLILLIREGQMDEALALLESAPELATQHTDQEGKLHGASPLHWAGHRNAVSLCERLIGLGANVNDSASDWWLTPLAWAADAGSAEAVELLLRFGAEVNQDAIVGTTALHAAAMGGSSRGKANPEGYGKTAEILLAHGANLHQRSNGAQGRTAMDEAMANHNTSVLAVLQKHGASCFNPGEKN